jgi:hypothetical protein
MKKEKPKQIEVAEWLYKGCFIQRSEHPELPGKYEVFKNNENQDHVGRCHTFTEAKRLCIENECFDNYLEY